MTQTYIVVANGTSQKGNTYSQLQPISVGVDKETKKEYSRIDNKANTQWRDTIIPIGTTFEVQTIWSDEKTTTNLKLETKTTTQA